MRWLSTLVVAMCFLLPLQTLQGHGTNFMRWAAYIADSRRHSFSSRIAIRMGSRMCVRGVGSPILVSSSVQSVLGRVYWMSLQSDACCVRQYTPIAMHIWTSTKFLLYMRYLQIMPSAFVLLRVNDHRQFPLASSFGMCDVAGACCANILVHNIYARWHFQMEPCILYMSFDACIWLVGLIVKL